MLSSLSETHLACSRYRVHDVVWMPRTDRADSSNSFSRFVFEFLYSPALHRALNALSLRDPNNVHVHSFFENIGNLHFLTEQLLRELQLILYSPAIDLHLHKIRFLLSYLGQAGLARGDNPHFHNPFFCGLEFFPAFVVVKFLGDLDSSSEVL